MAKDYAYRADHVGVLIKPRALDEAQQLYARGEIKIDQLREIENAAITAAVDMQGSIGLSVTTDGGFRRSAAIALELGGDTLAKTEAKSLRSLSRRPIKVAISAPRSLADAPADLALAEALVVKREIEALIVAGVDYIQLDASGYFAGPLDARRDAEPIAKARPQRALDELLEIDTAILSGINRPSSVRIAMHFTLGRDAAPACSSQADAAAERLFGTLPADRFIMSMHGAGRDFDLLRLVPAGKIAVLGLIDAAQPEPENVDDVMSWIDQAAKLIDGDYLAVSTASGFVAGTGISEAEQRRKLELVVEVATRWWGFAM